MRRPRDAASTILGHIGRRLLNYATRGDPGALAAELWLSGDLDGALAEETRIVERLVAEPAYGPSHVKTIRARDDRAVTLVGLKRYDDALAEFTWVVEALERSPEAGPDHEDTVAVKAHRAGCLLGLSRHDEALAGYTELDERYSDDPRFGLEHPTISIARRGREALLQERMNDRAMQAGRSSEEGRLEEALEGWTLAIEDALDHPGLGPQHPHTTLMMAKRATILELLGRKQEALAAFKRVIDASNDDASPEEHLLAAHEHRARLLLVSAGQLDKGVEDYTWLAETLTRHPAFGPDHQMTIRTRTVRALRLNDAGRHHEALLEHQRVVELLARSAGGDSPDALFSRLQLTYTLIMVGQYRVALDEADRVLAACHQQPETERSRSQADFAQFLRDSVLEVVPDVIAEMLAKATLAHVEERFEHALEHWSAIIELAEHHPDFGKAHEDTLTARGNRAVALMALGQRDAAIQEWCTVSETDELPQTPHLNFSAAIPCSGRNRAVRALVKALREFQESADNA
jgi:tetratricopeptide (TPR) repeat protein